MQSVFRTLPMKVTAFFLAIAAGTAVGVLFVMAVLAIEETPIIGLKSMFYSTDLMPCVIAAIIMFVLFVIFTIYLIVSAGRVRGSNESHLAPLNRVPFDLFLAVAVTGGAIAAAVIIEGVNIGHYREYTEFTSPENGAMYISHIVGFRWYMLVVCGAAGAGGLTMALAIFMSFSARVKAGKWWKNTLVFRILNLLYRVVWGIVRAIGTTFRHLPDVWKLMVSFVAYLLIDWILLYFAYENYNNYTALVLFVAFNVGILVLVCYIGVSFDALERGSKRLAAGEVDSKIALAQLRFVFRQHAENINAIGDGMQRAVEQRLRSERMKTELITNVSHDIKTPVTSIVNYADLLSKLQLPEPAAEYADVLLRQSNRLAKLTSDILEASKASTGNIPVELSVVDVSELIRQSVGEYAERLAERSIEAVVNAPQPVHAFADGKLLWRIADNLLSNVYKYAMSGTRLYVDVKEFGNYAAITFKNISQSPLNIDSQELTERFVRGDAARNSDGSGLGLNIAKSLTELQNGVFEITIDGDLFKIEIRFTLNQIGGQNETN